ncbi:protein of unknown function [Paraburkholderia kururiensis]
MPLPRTRPVCRAAFCRTSFVCRSIRRCNSRHRRPRRNTRKARPRRCVVVVTMAIRMAATCSVRRIEEATKTPEGVQPSGFFAIRVRMLEGVLVEPAGIEPASASSPQPVLHT